MSYNGWKNRETWNIALFINGEYPTYKNACDFMSDYDGKNPFQDFVDAYGYISTSDGVLFNDPKLDINELNDMMKELVD